MIYILGCCSHKVAFIRISSRETSYKTGPLRYVTGLLPLWRVHQVTFSFHCRHLLSNGLWSYLKFGEPGPSQVLLEVSIEKLRDTKKAFMSHFCYLCNNSFFYKTTDLNVNSIYKQTMIESKEKVRSSII